jgi:uncharacterized 2Fe-2S/4Fe-4S cluster protein (DUF4445 family)
MIRRTSETLPNGISITIIEAQDQIIQKNFDKRFQVVLFVEGKLHVPKNKKKYLEIRTNDYLCSLTTDDQLKIEVPVEAYLEKQMCDKTLEDCTTELLQYISMYNEGKDLRRELKLKYSI